MLAHRRVYRTAEHEQQVCRFAKALIVQGGADANFHQRNDRGRVPLTLAINTGRLELAKTLVKLGADPEARDGKKQTCWDVCAQHVKTCRQLRDFIENGMEEDDGMAPPWRGSRRSRRGTAPAEEIIRRL